MAKDATSREGQDLSSPKIAVKLPSEAVEVTVDLDKPRVLRFDSNAMEEFEEHTGRSTLDGSFHAESVKDMVTFIWACIQDDEDRPSIEEISKKLYLYQLGEIFDIAMRLLGKYPNDSKFLAPFVPTPMDVLDALIEFAGIKPGEKVWDLGSGDGRFVSVAMKKGAHAIGVELDEERVKISRDLLKIEKEEASGTGEIRQDFIQNQIEQSPDFPEADVVICYLMSYSNVRLAQTLKQQMKEGSRLLSVDFEYRDWASQMIELPDSRDQNPDVIMRRKRQIFKYRMPPKNGMAVLVDLKKGEK